MPSRHHLGRKRQRAATAVKRVKAARGRRKKKAIRLSKLAVEAVAAKPVAAKKTA